ncbi:MAG: ribonuclease P protein component 4 [Thermoplasmatota archaeon]
MSHRKHRRKQIARERVQRLFNLAERKALQDNMELANRYIALARKLSMKYLVRLTSQQRRRLCTRCHQYLLPGRTCRVRTGNQHLTVTCQECGAIMRFPYHQR